MKLERREFIRLAASGAVLPARSLRRALAQPLPNPSGVPAPSASERAAMARLAHAFMEKYDVPALSFAVGYAGEIDIGQYARAAPARRGQILWPGRKSLRHECHADGFTWLMAGAARGRRKVHDACRRLRQAAQHP